MALLSAPQKNQGESNGECVVLMTKQKRNQSCLVGVLELLSSALWSRAFKAGHSSISQPKSISPTVIGVQNRMRICTEALHDFKRAVAIYENAAEFLLRDRMCHLVSGTLLLWQFMP